MEREEYKKIVAKYTAFNAEQLKKYVGETYLDGYGYLPFIKYKKIVDIRRMSEVSKEDGEKYFKSLVALGKNLNSVEFYKLLNKLGSEYLSNQFKKEYVSRRSYGEAEMPKCEKCKEKVNLLNAYLYFGPCWIRWECPK